jgi:GNAT superfamily N-acetyltransferase
VPDTGPELRRRFVRDSDSAALIDLITACWDEYEGCVMDVDGEEPWLRAPASAYDRKGGTMWVVEQHGQLVACVGLLARGPDAELKSLYVGKPARRRGLGAELATLVESTAVERGATAITLWSDSRFTDAHRLYERLGYRRTGRARDLHDLSNTTEYEFARDLT